MEVAIAFVGAFLVALGLALETHPASRVAYIGACVAFGVAAVLALT